MGVAEMRVTIDVDTKGKPALDRYNKLRKLVGKEPEIFETHRGYHFIIRGLPISEEESLRIREQCGDDPLRIKLDRELEAKPSQVLWTYKNGFEAKRISEAQFLERHKTIL
jgi:hypothetical protein